MRWRRGTKDDLAVMLAPLSNALALLLCTAPQSPADALAAWLRDYRAGHAGYDALLLHEKIRAGTLADGQLLVAVLEHAASGDDRRAARGEAIRRELLDDLARLPCSLGVQAAVFDRVTAPHAAATDHDVDVTARLLPLLATFHPTRFRGTLEGFCTARDARLVLAAGRGLARMGAAASFAAAGSALMWFDADALARHVPHLLQLLATGNVDDDAQHHVLSLVHARIRGAPSHEVRRALLPLVERIRAVATIPLLIDELARTNAEFLGSGDVPTGLSFYLHDLQRALVALTGQRFPASEPERWRQFWAQEGAGFVLPPPASTTTTAAAAFYGIPVHGRRVLFVLDTSGSMRACDGGGALAGESRLDRAKRELLAAVAALDPAVEFDVLLFADRTRRLGRAFGPATAERRVALERLLERTVADGSTNLLDALEYGLAGQVQPTTNAERRSIDEVFVLTDGLPRTDPVRVLEATARWNVGRAARVHAVYVGIDDDTTSHDGRVPHGRALGPIGFMRALAAENGGVFRMVQ